jgi:hypothetical protein
MKTGLIYKIEVNKNDIYIGSTTQKLCARQNSHNICLKDINKNHRKLYKSCIENNINYIKCVWVADIKYDSIAELRMIEEQYRKDLNGNLNSRRCYITDTERKQTLEYITKWNKKNRENQKDDMIKVSKLLEKMF